MMTNSWACSRRLALIVAFFAAAYGAAPADAQYTNLHSFGESQTNGIYPNGNLVLDGTTLYGATSQGGGRSNGGTIFKMNVDGTDFTTLHVFNYNDGTGPSPNGTLIISNSVLYGMTRGGAVFKMNTDGSAFTNFGGFGGGPNNGSWPYGGLTLAESTLYATTSGGGSNGAGIIYKLNTDGTGFSILHVFQRGTNNGAYPCGSLTRSGTNLFGAASAGGEFDEGVIFKINMDGTGFSILRSFLGEPDDGACPVGSLALVGSNLYGATQYGGGRGLGGFVNNGTLFKINTDGTGYRLLHKFLGPADGYRPIGSLAVNGKALFGTTASGGAAYYYGSIFKINTDGSDYFILHSFTNLPDGSYPEGSLTADGLMVYGTTFYGGLWTNGTVFSFPSTYIQALANPPQAGKLLGGGPFPPGSTQQITAVAAYGWSFASWSDGESNSVRAAVVPTNSLTLTANFVVTGRLATVRNDFDGDGYSDFGCYYAPGGNWNIHQSSNGILSTQFGYAGTVPVSGDFDGDGKADICCCDTNRMAWYFMGGTRGFWSTNFGTVGGVPVSGDFDRDGKTDFGTYYAPAGEWKLSESSAGAVTTQFGFAGTLPVVADFDGDGKADFGCYHPVRGNWYLFQSRDGFKTMQFGFAGTLPVAGDFDGDGRDDIGCYHAPTGAWYFFESTDGFKTTKFGYRGTLPVIGNFGNKEKAVFSCYYPPEAMCYFFYPFYGPWQTQLDYKNAVPLN